MTQVQNRTDKSLTITRLHDDQTEAVVDLIQRNLGAFDEVGSVLAAAFRRTKHIATTYEQEGAAYFVLLDMAYAAQIVGGGGVGPLAGLPAGEGIGEIRELVIDERFRGQGYGRRLVAHCLEQALAMGYRRIYLETTPQMVHARRLFETFGFRPITHAPTKQSKGKKVEEDFPCYYLFEAPVRENRSL